MWIEFSEFNLKILILLIFPVSKRIQDYSKKAYLVKDHQLFKTFRYFASYIFAFIPLLIMKYRTKKVQDPIKEANKEPEERATRNGSMSTNEIDELKKKHNRQRKIKSYIFLGILCIIGLFCYFYRYLFEKTQFAIAKQSIGIFFEIFDYVALSHFILKQKLYKHNFVFAGIIGIVVFILFLISIRDMESGYIFTSFVYYFFFSMCFGVYDVLGKLYMIKFFKSPYFLMFSIGTINTILLLIYDFFAYFLNKDVSGIIIGFQNNILSVGDVFIFIIDLILQCIWNLGIWLTVYYFTPCHYFISEYISEYVYYMIAAVPKKEGFYSVVNIVIFSISYFINFLCGLFFNEVLILNLFGLDYNTKKRIEERLQKESEETEKANKMLEMDSPKDEEDEENN